jgi:hypothetical protein
MIAQSSKSTILKFFNLFFTLTLFVIFVLSLVESSTVNYFYLDNYRPIYPVWQVLSILGVISAVALFTKYTFFALKTSVLVAIAKPH